MPKVNTLSYAEQSPHRLKRILWMMINNSLFRICGNQYRRKLLNMFGACCEPGMLYGSSNIYAPWNLKVGYATCIGPRVEIYNKDKVTIGSMCAISQDAYLCTASHDIDSKNMALVTKPITIDDNVWVAAKAIVLPGVSLGEGAVVGCAAVVTKSVEPWSVVGGNPAKFLKKRMLREE